MNHKKEELDLFTCIYRIYYEKPSLLIDLSKSKNRANQARGWNWITYVSKFSNI